MKISKDKVVSLSYTVTDDEGTVLVSNESSRPLDYLHGYGNIVKGLEKALEAQDVGFTGSVTLSPEEGYGKHCENALLCLPRQHFPPHIEPGMQFHLQRGDDFTSMTVISVNKTMVTLDTNHPLAGKTLHFVIEVLAVRDASEHELAQKHVDWS